MCCSVRMVYLSRSSHCKPQKTVTSVYNTVYTNLVQQSGSETLGFNRIGTNCSAVVLGTSHSYVVQ